MSKIDTNTPGHRFKEALNMQDIEGNPLTPEEIAMFEMFEREGWSHEKRRAYIIRQFEKSETSSAAE